MAGALPKADGRRPHRCPGCTEQRGAGEAAGYHWVALSNSHTSNVYREQRRMHELPQTPYPLSRDLLPITLMSEELPVKPPPSVWRCVLALSRVGPQTLAPHSPSTPYLPVQSTHPLRNHWLHFCSPFGQ